MEQMTEQQKTMNEMIDKMSTTSNTTNNTMNNITNNNFNINMFLNEKCKDAINFSDFIDRIEVSHDDLENNAQLGIRAPCMGVYGGVPPYTFHGPSDFLHIHFMDQHMVREMYPMTVP